MVSTIVSVTELNQMPYDFVIFFFLVKYIFLHSGLLNISVVFTYNLVNDLFFLLEETLQNFFCVGCSLESSVVSPATTLILNILKIIC